MKNLSRILLAGGLSGCLAQAAPITWSTPVAPATAADTITEGSLVFAQNNADNEDATINGIVFAATTGPGASNANGTFYGNDAGDPGLNTLLDSHNYQTGGFSFELTGLTVGGTYKIQIWAVGDTRSCCATRIQQYGDGELVENLSDPLTRDSGGAVVGEFVADATTQTITVNGPTDPGLSGMQLRDVTPQDDTDLDGLPDVWEQALINFDPNDAVTGLADVKGPNDAPATSDFDGDGLTDADEFANSSDPNNQDTDGDTLLDGEEVNTYGTSPTRMDTDGDSLTDDVEVAAGTSDPTLADTDADGVNDNLDGAPTDPGNDDDGDGLSNIDETNTHGSNPLLADTDGDTLSDFDEVMVHFTDPTLADSDGDSIDDGTEIIYGTDPNLADSVPFIATSTVLGTGTGALLGGDLTDPENDGIDTENTAGSNFNWVSITSSSKSYFTDATAGGVNEGAFDIFDNKVGGGEAKWCCDPGPQNVTVEFAGPTALTHFTVTSGNDSPNRDPRVWGIYGSNDGINFEPIYARSDAPGTALWTARNQVIRFDLPVPSAAYTFIRYQVDAMRTGTTQHQLCEVEYFGETNPADSDGGGLLDIYEVAVGLNPDDAGDDTGDLDSDGLNNVQEAERGTNPKGSDTDNDGLSDGDEVNTHGSSPTLQDSDGDGLKDGDEVNTHGSDPTLVDTDGDTFDDGLEVAEGSDPALATSLPNLTVISESLVGLLGGDITDPQDDGVESATPWTSGWAFADVVSSGENYFGGVDGSPNEGAWDVFDNRVGGGNDKWCCDPAPQSVAVQFHASFQLTHFTMTSGNDSPDRDPADWAIQGSNDGIAWTDVYPAPGTNDANYLRAPWTARNQTLVFTLPAPSAPYKWFRYSVNQVRGPNLTLHQLNEIELFGIRDDTDTDGGGVPDWYEDLYAFLNPGNAADDDLDQDGDGLTNEEEFLGVGTDPGVADTDGDGLDDNLEIGTHGTNPLVADSDGDGATDADEIAAGTDPNDPLDFPVIPFMARLVSVDTAGGEVVIEWNSLNNGTATYDVYASDSLSGDPLINWDIVASVVPTGGLTTRITETAIGSGSGTETLPVPTPARRFYAIYEYP